MTPTFMSGITSAARVMAAGSEAHRTQAQRMQAGRMCLAALAGAFVATAQAEGDRFVGADQRIPVAEDKRTRLEGTLLVTGGKHAGDQV
jgi:hypothetical protein